MTGVRGWRWVWGVFLFCALTAIAAPAQTYTDVFNFNNLDGCGAVYSGIVAQGRDGNLYGTAYDCGGYGDGVVFKITPSGSMTVLHNFGSADGSIPTGGLTLGTDGNLYGTTLAGGANNSGTIFRITPGGHLTTLYSFTSNAYGANAPPIEDADGNFYGTTGNGNLGTAYRITPLGAFTSFGSIPGESSAPLLLGTDGNFYGTTSSSANGNPYGTAFRMTPKGKVTVVYSFDFTHGSSPVAPLIQATDGNFYGTTSGGGDDDGGVVFKLTPEGVITVLHSFELSNPLDGNSPTAGLVQATDGNLYGATPFGGSVGSGYGVIFGITAGGSYSVLYNFDYTNGATPYSTPMQQTGGGIYSLANAGGSFGWGVFYSFEVGLKPFIRFPRGYGKVGQTGGILGQGFTGTTSVAINGITANFTVVSDTYIKATVPAGATTGYVTVITPSGTLTSNVAFHVIR